MKKAKASLAFGCLMPCCRTYAWNFEIAICFASAWLGIRFPPQGAAP
jgi:hypothetical protein